MLRWLARVRPLTTGVLIVGVSGCASTWDDITSQRFRNAPYSTIMGHEDPPLQVLRENRTGDERVRAMQKLSEPIRNGGTQAQQDEAIELLTKIASSDPHALCRLNAIEALGRFDDPRANSALVAAFRASDSPSAIESDVQPTGIGASRNSPTGFSPEIVTMIQCRSLDKLGEKKSPEALPLIIEVANRSKVAPPGENDEARPGLTGQNSQDVRLAAVRALGEYPNNPQTTATLVRVMRKESDVAIRGRAHENLIKLTGRELPPDSEEWDTIVQPIPTTIPKEPVPIRQVGTSGKN